MKGQDHILMYSLVKNHVDAKKMLNFYFPLFSCVVTRSNLDYLHRWADQMYLPICSFFGAWGTSSLERQQYLHSNLKSCKIVPTMIFVTMESWVFGHNILVEAYWTYFYSTWLLKWDGGRGPKLILSKECCELMCNMSF